MWSEAEDIHGDNDEVGSPTGNFSLPLCGQGPRHLRVAQPIRTNSPSAAWRIGTVAVPILLTLAVAACVSLQMQRGSGRLLVKRPSSRSILTQEAKHAVLVTDKHIVPVTPHAALTRAVRPLVGNNSAHSLDETLSRKDSIPSQPQVNSAHSVTVNHSYKHGVPSQLQDNSTHNDSQSHSHNHSVPSQPTDSHSQSHMQDHSNDGDKPLQYLDNRSQGLMQNHSDNGDKILQLQDNHSQSHMQNHSNDGDKQSQYLDNRSQGLMQKHSDKREKPLQLQDNHSQSHRQNHSGDGDQPIQYLDTHSQGLMQNHSDNGEKPLQLQDNHSQDHMQNHSDDGDQPLQLQEQQQHQKQTPKQKRQQQQTQEQTTTKTQTQQAPQPLPPPPLMQGISYGPSPLMQPGNLPNDDFMCSAAKQQWGTPGRNDLGVIKALGANSVRLYGNDPTADHGDFLDAAEALELHVLPGISDFPYLQSPHSCKMADGYDCSSTIFDAYLGNLRRGYLRNRSYHPSLSYVIAINEPDMKLPDIHQPRLFCKAIISAIDGILVAEEEAGVVGPRPNLTATFSFSVCGNRCGYLGQKPALGQMWMLRDAMLHPQKYDYKARYNLSEVYRTRFTHSFNTGNPSWDIPRLFLQDYEKEFHETPVFIAEYHCPNQNTQTDVARMLEIARGSRLLLGISFFEYMVRYDVAGHTDFGLFYPRAHRQEFPGSPLQGMDYFGQRYDVPCLVPKDALPWQLGAAFHGDAEKAVQLLQQQEVCS